MTDPVTDAPPTTDAPPPPPPAGKSAQLAVRETMTPHERFLYASSLAPARMLPGELRGSTADVLLRVEYGYSLGIPPISAISAVHIVEGKPTASAGLISALIRGAGHRFRLWTEPDDAYPGEVKAIATVVRKDDPDFEYRVEWTIDRAIAARLLRRLDDGKIVAVKSGSAWDTYRAGMLKARATSEIGRDACEDVLLGVHYTAEELGAPTDAAGEYVDAEVVSDVTTPRPSGRDTSAPPPADPYAAAAAPTVEQTGPAYVDDPDLVGAAIRSALSKRQIVDNLVELGLAWAEPTARGGFVYRKDVLEAVEVVVDEQTGQLAPAWRLMAEHAAGLPRTVDGDEGHEDGGSGAHEPPAGPTGGGPGSGGGQDRPGSGGPEKGVQRSDHAPAGEWQAHPDGTATVEGDPDELPLDRCNASGCVDPSSHLTADHVAWAARRRQAAPGEPTEIHDADVVDDEPGAADGADGYLELDPTDQGVPDRERTAREVAQEEARRAAHAAKVAADEEAAALERERKAPTTRKRAAPKDRG